MWWLVSRASGPGSKFGLNRMLDDTLEHVAHLTAVVMWDGNASEIRMTAPVSGWPERFLHHHAA